MLKTSLRYFTSVAARGSIRAASVDLNVAQSAVSRQIQALEYELGTELLDRHSRGISLTEAGDVLFRYAKSAALDIDRLRSELDELAGLERGYVRIAAIETMVPHILPRALRAFHEMHPGINYSVNIATTDDVVNMVHEGHSDIGLAFSPIIGSEIELLYERIEPLLAVMSLGHPLATRDKITMEEASRFALALSPPRSGARIVIDRACRAAKLKVTPLLESNSVELLLRMVVISECIAPLLPHTVSYGLQNDLVRAMPFSDPNISGTVAIIALEGRSLPLAAKKMCSVISAELDATSSAINQT